MLSKYLFCCLHLLKKSCVTYHWPLWNACMQCFMQCFNTTKLATGVNKSACKTSFFDSFSVHVNTQLQSLPDVFYFQKKADLQNNLCPHYSKWNQRQQAAINVQHSLLWNRTNVCMIWGIKLFFFTTKRLNSWVSINISPPVLLLGPTMQKLQTNAHNSSMRSCNCRFLQDQPVLIPRECLPEHALICRNLSSLPLNLTILCSDIMTVREEYFSLTDVGAETSLPCVCCVYPLVHCQQEYFCQQISNQLIMKLLIKINLESSNHNN